MVQWHWRYRPKSKGTVNNTTSYASHLCQIWKESIQNCTWCKADTTRCDTLYQFYCKSWLNDLEHINQGQRSLHVTHLLMLVIICTKYGKNPSRTGCAVERTRQNVIYVSAVFTKLHQHISFCRRQLLNGRCRGKIFCKNMYWTPAKMLSLADVDVYSFANAGFRPRIFSMNIGLNMLPLDSFMSCLHSQLGYSTGEFQG